MRQRCALSLSILTMAACSSGPETSWFAWPALQDYAVSFLVAGEQVHPPMVGEPPSAALQIRGVDFGEIAVVGIPDSALEGLNWFDPDRLAEAELELRSETCSDGRAFAEELRRIPLPAASEVLALDEESRGFRVVPRHQIEALDEVALTIPSIPEACRVEGEDQLARFDSRETLLPIGLEVEGVEQTDEDDLVLRGNWILPLSRDRILLLTSGGLFLFDRGGVYVDSPAHRLEVSRLPQPPVAEPWAFRRVAWIPGSRHESGGSVLLLGRTEEPNAWSALFEIEISADGFRYAREIGIFEGVELDEMAIDPTGFVIVGGKEGAAFTATSARGRYSRSDRYNLDFDALIATNDEDISHVISLDQGGILVGNAAREAFVEERPLEATSSINALASHVGPDGLEVFAANSHGQMFRRSPAGIWREVPLRVPQRASICTRGVEDACGFQTPSGQKLSMLVVDPRYARNSRIYVQAGRCSAIFGIDLRTDCLTVLPTGPIDLTETYHHLSFLLSDPESKRLLLGRGGGRIYELFLEDARGR